MYTINISFVILPPMISLSVASTLHLVNRQLQRHHHVDNYALPSHLSHSLLTLHGSYYSQHCPARLVLFVSTLFNNNIPTYMNPTLDIHVQ